MTAQPLRHNWSGSVRFDPARRAYPASEAEVAALLADAATRGEQVRVVGAGHSFMPLAATDGLQLCLDRLCGLIDVDPSSGEATLWGGTRIREIAGLLAPHGRALASMGDIDAQALAGAVSTATHGTGLAFTGYSALVTRLRLALPSGELVDVDRHHRPELFEAARVGLGCLGVITRVTLRTVPSFGLATRETTEPVDAVIDGFLDRAERADHLEFFWFPGTPRATVKETTRLSADAPLHPLGPVAHLVNRELLGNGAYGALCRAAFVAPRVASAVRGVASRYMAGGEFSDHSHRVFVAPRRVRFEETEYAVPAEALPEAVRAVERALVRSGEQVTFPLEVRIGAADDTWLGMASGRTSAYIAVHRYRREPFAPILAAVEPVFADYAGRPHWGKRHTLTADDVARLYPRYEDFCRVRTDVDPQGVLLNPLTRSLWG